MARELREVEVEVADGRRLWLQGEGGGLVAVVVGGGGSRPGLLGLGFWTASGGRGRGRRRGAARGTGGKAGRAQWRWERERERRVAVDARRVAVCPARLVGWFVRFASRRAGGGVVAEE